MSWYSNLQRNFYNHPIECLLTLVLLCLLMFSIFGCAVKPEDVNSWSNEAQAAMLQFQGRVTNAVNAVNSDLEEVKETVDAVHGTISTGIDWAQGTIYTLGVGGLGAGGLAGANRFRKRNGTDAG